MKESTEKHDTNCDCEECEHDQVTLTMDDGSEILCDILSIFPCGDKEYIALFPADGDDDTNVFLYQFVAHDEEDIELINIESDEEFEAVSEAFDELLDSEEFDELYGDDDETEEE